MIIKQEFSPIVLTIQSKEEFDALWSALYEKTKKFNLSFSNRHDDVTTRLFNSIDHFSKLLHNNR